MRYVKFVLPQFNGRNVPLLILEQFHNHNIFASTRDLRKYKDDVENHRKIHWSLFPKKLFVWLMMKTKNPAFYRGSNMYIEYCDDGIPWRI